MSLELNMDKGMQVHVLRRKNKEYEGQASPFMGLGKAFIMLKEKTFLQNQFSSSMHGKDMASRKIRFKGKGCFLEKKTYS